MYIAYIIKYTLFCHLMAKINVRTIFNNVRAFSQVQIKLWSETLPFALTSINPLSKTLISIHTFNFEVIYRHCFPCSIKLIDRPLFMGKGEGECNASSERTPRPGTEIWSQARKTQVTPSSKQ